MRKQTRFLLTVAFLASLLLPVQGWGAVALVSSLSAGSTDGQTFTTGTFDSSGANFIVCGLGNYQAFEPVVTDNKGNTPYVVTLTSQSSVDTRAHLVYFVNPTVGAGHSFTVTGANNYSGIGCLAFSGINTSSLVDVENGANGGSLTLLATGSIATVAGAVAVTALCMHNDGETAAIDNGFTKQEEVLGIGGQRLGVVVAYKLNPGTVNPTWSWVTSSYAATAIASFKAAGTVGRRSLMLLRVGQ